MSALKVTFYSYKGGVGRTLALFNVGALLAANGRKVVAVDLDLEAPGLGRSRATRRLDGAELGVSDLLEDRLQGGERDFREFTYALPDRRFEGRFNILPVGTKPSWLAGMIPGFYRDLASDEALIFRLLVGEIERGLSPDFILFDSRTGRADVAGIALLELPDVIVAMSGLNEQNVGGMEGVLEQLRHHKARKEGVLTLLGLSPIPDQWILAGPPWLEKVPLDPRLAEVIALDEAVRNAPRAVGSLRELLFERVAEVNARLRAAIQEDFVLALRGRFPGLDERDLLHTFGYDPLVPLTDELQVTRFSDLSLAYGRLADAIARARPNDPGLPELWRDRRGPLLPS